MDKNAKIYVAGHRGLVGSALMRQLIAQGYTNLITRSHADLDLTNQASVWEFFASERPEFAFLAAAKVGGIVANSTYPAEFIYSNLAIQNNVIHSAWEFGLERMLFLGSSCIYPRDCPQPIKEEYLLTGPLEPTNRPYALAKIAGVEMCHAYNRQYGTKFLAAMPTNLYGPNDSYDLQNSHVLPALIRKMHEAKTRKDMDVTVWGTGAPCREFLYSDDLADACIFLMNLPEAVFASLLSSDAFPIVNIGYGEDVTIRELAEAIKDTVKFNGVLQFDLSKPDGTPRKLLDVERLNRLGWKAKTSLREGLQLAYADYLENKISV